jgi:S1-C subfamily serine protease
MRFLRLGLAVLCLLAPGLAPAQPSASPAADPPPSAAGQRIYEGARQRLVQVRTLLRAQDSQASVGSGFLVTDEGHLITNYHVVSDVALQPQPHRLVYSTADGRHGALQLLAVDVVHDLALLRLVEPKALAGRGAFEFRPAERPPARGERIFALGNPLDVGFAVVEGAYNGLTERSFVPTVFFGGSLSAGMSGGPALDDQGRVMGVNVATRRDGEQVSFLVPGAAAQALLQRGRDAAPVTEPLYGEIARQLTAHQQRLVDSFLGLPWRTAGHGRYAIPVPQETYMRCWGSTTPAGAKGLEFERSDCAMDSRVFVSHVLVTGHVVVRHEAYDGRRLGALRFAQRHSASFQNESFGNKTTQWTAPVCHEGEVARQAGTADGAPPLRTVMCLRAYRKLPGLYDVSVLVATLDHPTLGVQGRFDARGVSFDNALRLATHYLDGYAWQAPKNGSR